MSAERNPDTDSQAAPVINDRPYIQDMVIADIETRKQFGIAKYGTALQAGNGRDMLLDAYEEALDLVIYLRGALEERDGVPVESEAPVDPVEGPVVSFNFTIREFADESAGKPFVYAATNMDPVEAAQKLRDAFQEWLFMRGEPKSGLVKRDTVFAADLPDDAPLLTPLDPGWEGEAGVPQMTTNPYYRDPPLPVWDRVKKWLRRE